jgi:hypothetical protein
MLQFVNRSRIGSRFDHATAWLSLRCVFINQRIMANYLADQRSANVRFWLVFTVQVGPAVGPV